MSVQKEELTDVSVIIPVYNRGQFFAECIQSVLDQKTDFPVEIVCADDGYNPSVSVAWFFVLKNGFVDTNSYKERYCSRQV